MADKKLINELKMPVGKGAKKKLDEWLNENVNLPLAKRGMEDTGAAISAAISAGGELLIPDDLADAALAMVPGAKLVRSGRKGMKAIQKIVPGLEKAGTIDYGTIKKAEETARKAKLQKIEKEAPTLQWGPEGEITRKPPTMWDNQLRDLEKKAKKQER